jgi:hypothetical protein
MKPLIALAIVVLTAFGLSQAIGRNSPDRPPGIAANQWAPISESLGVVLVPDAEHGTAAQQKPYPLVDTSGTALYARPTAVAQAFIEEGNPVNGYLMVKRGKFWRPLVVVAPSSPG